MYVLDTNVVSELRKIETGRVDPRVKSWANKLPSGSAFLSVITVMELEQGTLSMERRDPRQGAMLRAWLERQILVEFDGQLLPVDLQIAKRCASLHVPNPFSYRDSLIAATALVHGMTVVTRDVADFKRTGVRLLNPWEG
jgi:predicted nucleic acid-binding protein